MSWDVVRHGRVLLILDQPTLVRAGHSALDVARAACDAGVRLFQWRDKAAAGRALYSDVAALAALLAPYDAALLVNGRADVALAAGARGAHRPGDGLPIAALRALLGPGALISAAAHSTDEAVQLGLAGADLVLLSPIFATPSKPGYGPALGCAFLSDVTTKMHTPIFALGGITPQTTEDVIKSGAQGIAVMGGILAHPVPYEAARAYVEAAGRSASQRVG